jgi:hypothetical protein
MTVTEERFQESQDSLNEHLKSLPAIVNDMKTHIDVLTEASIEGFVETYKVNPERAVREMKNTLRECITAAIGVSVITEVMDVL